MKLVFLLEHLDRSRGGAETFVLGLSRNCAGRGHDVHIVTQSAAPEAAPDGVEIHVAGAGGVPAWQRTLSFDRNATRITAALAPDVAVGVERTSCHNVLRPSSGTYRASRRQNRAAARTPFARALKRAQKLISIKERVYLSIERRQYAARNVEFIAPSDMVKRDMMSYYKVPEERIHVVYNGVDTERYAPENRRRFRERIRADLGVSDEEILLLIVAHNFAQKGVDRFIDVIAALARRLPLKGVVVGKGKQKRFRALAERLGVSDRVRFTGATSGTEPYYAAADIYLHPAWYDACPNVVLEALASGLPVVTTRFNGAAGLIEEGKQGYVVDEPTDCRALAEAVLKLSDESARREAADASRALASEHTLERNLDEIMQVFEIAKERSPLKLR